MKRLLLVLILTFSFQTLTKADDITDFQIEGISIGDSLLSFADLKKINSIKSKQQHFNDKYIIFDVDKILDVKNYDYMGATIKKNDKNYIVTSLSGILNYKNLGKCLKKKVLIQKDIEKLLTYDSMEEVKYPSQRDKTGESIIYGVQFYFKPYPSVEAITVNCAHFTKESNIVRTLKVSANSEDYAYFLIHEAHK
tara:strand:- start:69 stop:653 length:585 start_codon:yes stop_codon:yes gene_type:complete